MAPMPMGPHGKAFPTIGYAGWAMFAGQPAQGRRLEADRDAVVGPRAISTGRSSSASIPIHKGAEKDPFFATEQFKGWFTELNDPRWVLTAMPTYLEEFGYFADVGLDPGRPAGAARRAHRRRTSPSEWADYLTGDAAEEVAGRAPLSAVRRRRGSARADAATRARSPVARLLACVLEPYLLCRRRRLILIAPGDAGAADRRHRATPSATSDPQPVQARLGRPRSISASCCATRCSGTRSSTRCGGPSPRWSSSSCSAWAWRCCSSEPFAGRKLVQALVFLPWAVPSFLSGPRTGPGCSTRSSARCRIGCSRSAC